MTNVKNITDLPIAESSDGLNLIVNDGGSAKQIAASAVGAQADWNVTDEASPAFIKNKPETAQADWEIEDETNAAFIKNKPFVDTREYETASLTFDGDINGKEYIELGACLVKISDDVISIDGLIGGHVSVYNIADNKTETVEITGSNLSLFSPELIDIAGSILIASDNTTIGDQNITRGVWFMYLDQFAYISELSYRVVSGGELKQIDEKFIPEKAFAQADWAETDATSVAFIKNKPVEEWDLDLKVDITWNTETSTQNEPVFTANEGYSYDNFVAKLESGKIPTVKIQLNFATSETNTTSEFVNQPNIAATSAMVGCMWFGAVFMCPVGVLANTDGTFDFQIMG